MWRQDTNDEVAAASLTDAAPLGEFSILSNLEDPAEPPSLETRLRPEQLGSLGALNQERNDAAHWRLEGSLRCEYLDVRGGVLAAAIGCGKTACTIGLIDKTKELPVPRVPMPYRGFVPSPAILVLAPRNPHGHWISDIQKLTGRTLKVLSVATCAQLQKFSMKDLTEADVVLVTYRLFYPKAKLNPREDIGQTTGLLKLCSHFCISGDSELVSAQEECRGQLALRHELNAHCPSVLCLPLNSQLAQLCKALGLWSAKVAAIEEVRGHTQHPWNELADAIAKWAVSQAPAFTADEAAPLHRLAQCPHDLGWAWMQTTHASMAACFPADHTIVHTAPCPSY